MFHQNYQKLTHPGTNFKRYQEKDVLDPLKHFLAQNNLPSTIVKGVSFQGYFCIHISLEKGSVEKYGVEMKSAFKVLRCNFSLIHSECVQDMIECDPAFIDALVETNNKRFTETWSQEYTKSNNHI